MKTLVLKINSRNPEKSRIRIAASVIKSGGLVVFPTETVYGIGANALDAKACAKIFMAKERARDNPLIVHVANFEMAEKISHLPERYKKTIKKIWPAPLTLILRAKKNLPKTVTAGLDTVAVRMPDSKIAIELIRQSGVPIAAPSANISKKPSSTSAKHALKYFKGKVSVIIDSGRSEYGLESTILDLGRFMVLRPGAYTMEEIEKNFGKKPRCDEYSLGYKESEKAISPGMKYRHYSPDTPLFLFAGNIKDLNDLIKKSKSRIAFLGSNESCNLIHSDCKIKLGRNLKEIGKNLFDGLIKLDSLGVDFAIAESFESKGYGLAIMNRLRKATNHKSFRNLKELEKIRK